MLTVQCVQVLLTFLKFLTSQLENTVLVQAPSSLRAGWARLRWLSSCLSGLKQSIMGGKGLFLWAKVCNIAFPAWAFAHCPMKKAPLS